MRGGKPVDGGEEGNENREEGLTDREEER